MIPPEETVRLRAALETAHALGAEGRPAEGAKALSSLLRSVIATSFQEPWWNEWHTSWEEARDQYIATYLEGADLQGADRKAWT